MIVMLLPVNLFTFHTTAGTEHTPEINIFLIAGYETTRYNPSSLGHNSVDFRRHDSYAITRALIC